MDIPSLGREPDDEGPNGRVRRDPDTLTNAELDAAILAAHAEGDGWLLCDLYERAATIKQTEGDEEAEAFLLTQAFVFALECAHPRADALQRALFERGREARPS